jgi:thymidylate synthase
MRDNRLDINYHIRSCDLYKHFRNDVYLTVRLLLWMLERLRGRDSSWAQVQPGRFLMQIGSLHLFRSDWEKI